MSTIYQQCPACSSKLELPVAAVGRMGQCPSCLTTFQVVMPVDDQIPDSVSSEVSADATGAVEPPPETATVSVYQTPAAEAAPPISPDENPFSAPLATGDIESDPQLMAAAPTMQPVAQMTKLEVGRSSTESIVSATMAIFGLRWPSLVIAFVVVVAVQGFVTLVPWYLISEMADAGGDVAAGLVALVWVPVLVVSTAFFAVGLPRVALAVARDFSPSHLSELFPPMQLVLRFLGGALLISVVIGGISLLLIGSAAVVGNASGNGALATVLGVAAILVIAVIQAVFQWLFWSWWMIVCDAKGTTLGSLRQAVSITMNNKLTSLMLILIAATLTMMGSLLCALGHVITVPMTLLLFSVAYLQITDQPYGDPRERQPPRTPPTQPSF